MWSYLDEEVKLEAKDVLPNKPHAAVEITAPAATEWSRVPLRDVICIDRVTMRHAAERTILSLLGVTE